MSQRFCLGFLLCFILACSSGSSPTASKSSSSSSSSSSGSSGSSSQTSSSKKTDEPTTDALKAADVAATAPQVVLIDIPLSGIATTGEELTYEIVDNPVHGAVSVSGSTAHYISEADYEGDDPFTYRVTGTSGVSEPATVTVTVLGATTGGTITITVPAGGFTAIPMEDPQTIADQQISYDFGDNSRIVGQDGSYIYRAPNGSEGTAETYFYKTYASKPRVKWTLKTVIVANTMVTYTDCSYLLPTTLNPNKKYVVGQVLYTWLGGRSLPVRRSRLQGDLPDGISIQETYTDDNGCYLLEADSLGDSLPLTNISIFADSLSEANGGGNTADGIGSENFCNGSTWNISVRDSSTVTPYKSDFSNNFIEAGNVITWNHIVASDLVATDIKKAVSLINAFNAIDAIISSMELVCTADPKADFGKIVVNFGVTQDDDIGWYHSIDENDGEIVLSGVISPSWYSVFGYEHEFCHHLQYHFYSMRDYQDVLNRVEKNKHYATSQRDYRATFAEGYCSGFPAAVADRRVGDGFDFVPSYFGKIDTGMNTDIGVADTVHKLIKKLGYKPLHEVYSNVIPTIPVFQTLHAFGVAMVSKGYDVANVFDEGRVKSDSLTDYYDSNGFLWLYEPLVPMKYKTDPCNVTDSEDAKHSILSDWTWPGCDGGESYRLLEDTSSISGYLLSVDGPHTASYGGILYENFGDIDFNYWHDKSDWNHVGPLDYVWKGHSRDMFSFDLKGAPENPLLSEAASGWYVISSDNPVIQEQGVVMTFFTSHTDPDDPARPKQGQPQCDYPVTLVLYQDGQKYYTAEGEAGTCPVIPPTAIKQGRSILEAFVPKVFPDSFVNGLFYDNHMLDIEMDTCEDLGGKTLTSEELTAKCSNPPPETPTAIYDDCNGLTDGCIEYSHDYCSPEALAGAVCKMHEAVFGAGTCLCPKHFYKAYCSVHDIAESGPLGCTTGICKSKEQDTSDKTCGDIPQ